MILNCVIGASGEELGNGGPLVAVLGVCGEDGFVFFGGEGSVVDAGAELVAPPEAAGFARTAGNAEADERPVARAALFDEARQLLVFFGAPWPFNSCY